MMRRGEECLQCSTKAPAAAGPGKHSTQRKYGLNRKLEAISSNKTVKLIVADLFQKKN